MPGHVAAKTKSRYNLIAKVSLAGIVLSIGGLAWLFSPWLTAQLLFRYHVRSVARITTQSNQKSASSPSEQAKIPPRQSEWSLIIPTLSIDTPIMTGISMANSVSYEAALKKGVVLAKENKPLDATAGNSFIFGHSSRLTLHPTPFDTIFATLDQLKVGDAVQIYHNTDLSQFLVTRSEAVGANDVTVLANPADRHIITLMTCWPLGTNAKRWIIQATAN